jgi:hypothetical protein
MSVSATSQSSDSSYFYYLQQQRQNASKTQDSSSDGALAVAQFDDGFIEHSGLYAGGKLNQRLTRVAAISVRADFRINRFERQFLDSRFNPRHFHERREFAFERGAIG